MTKTQAPTDREMLDAYSAAEAERARTMLIVGMLGRLTVRGRSIAQAKRSQLAPIVVAMGLNAASMTKAAMLAAIEGRA